MPASWLMTAVILILWGGVPSNTTAGDAESPAPWPHWRGPLYTGEAPAAEPPVNWGEELNVHWKVPLPGLGHATPVGWADTLFLTYAEPFGPELEPRYSGAPGAHNNLPVTRRYRFGVLAVDRSNGEIRWNRVVKDALPHAGGHTTASLASNSPVTDGQRVYACFGSHGLYCLTTTGEPVWEKDLGRMQTKHGHGEGASPVLHEGKLFVNWDHEGDSFLVAFDAVSGEELWRVPRNEVTSWASPILVEHAGQAQLIVSGTGRVRAYHPADGKVLWECGGLSDNVVASPVAGQGMVFAGSSYETRNLLAIRLEGARGDLTGTDHVAWSTRRGTPYVPSPLLYQGSLYFLAHYQGVLSKLDARTGEPQGGPFRLADLRNIYASPVAAAGRIYITDREGRTLVLSHEEQPRLLALNRLDDTFSASAVPMGKALYLRGEKFLYALRKE